MSTTSPHAALLNIRIGIERYPDVCQIGPPTRMDTSAVSTGNGAVGQAYDGEFFFGGGLAPYRWSISAATLSPGLVYGFAGLRPAGSPCGDQM